MKLQLTDKFVAPENIARPEVGKRFAPEVAEPLEATMSFLMNLLIIEFRAEIGFAADGEGDSES